MISISDGQAEGTFSQGAEQITAQDPGELSAAAAGIPVLVGTGDCDVVQALPLKNSPCTKVTKGPSTAAWDDSPWVTAMATRLAHQDAAVRQVARAGGTSYLQAGDFLPGHPVRLSIDGKLVVTLSADTLGSVAYVLDPSLLKLPAGSHVLTLSSMLLTETARFSSS